MYALLSPLFTPLSNAAVAQIYPLTAISSQTPRPLPDCIYGVVRSHQRTYNYASVATIVGFLLEIRASTYADLLEKEDSVRAALNFAQGIETVDASDDYDEKVNAYVTRLDVEMSTPIADLLVMEISAHATGQAVCRDFYLNFETEYAVIYLSYNLEALHARRNDCRKQLVGWIETPKHVALSFLEGQALAINCGLFAWVDIFKQSEYTG